MSYRPRVSVRRRRLRRLSGDPRARAAAAERSPARRWMAGSYDPRRRRGRWRRGRHGATERARGAGGGGGRRQAASTLSVPSVRLRRPCYALEGDNRDEGPDHPTARRGRGPLRGRRRPVQPRATAPLRRHAERPAAAVAPVLVASTLHPDLHRRHVGSYAALAEEVRKQWTDSGRAQWMEAWPSGIRYDVRCLDGGAWDRSTSWGMFATLEEALACIRDRRPRPHGMTSTKIRCHCGRRLWWGAEMTPRRHWVPPTGRELEPDLIEDCTPNVAVPTTCPEHRAS